MQTNRNSLYTMLLSAALMMFLITPVMAQKTKAKSGPENPPQYPGGTPALMDFMIKNMKYPEAAKKANAEGMVLVRFTVEKDGSLSKIQTITEGSKNPREDFVRESVRVIKSMPKWVPGSQGGKTVRAEMTLPIKFALTDDKKP